MFLSISKISLQNVLSLFNGSNFTINLTESVLMSTGGLDKFDFFTFPESFLGLVFLRLAVESSLGIISKPFISGLSTSLSTLFGNISVQLCGHSSSEGVVSCDSSSLVFNIISTRGGNILSDGNEFGDDSSKSLWVESGGELDERKKWVGVTDFLHSLDDLFDFSKLSGSSVVSLDVTKV
jgi:hypothetical protein